MVTIHGRSLNPGVAIAVAAIVDANRGLGAVSPSLLAEGERALKAMLPVQDYPEAVVVCDTLALGLAISIPGINTVGIAAESDTDAPVTELRVPCVVGLPNLIKSVSEGDIVIVDGGKGIVYVDPDLETIVRYQELEQLATSGSLVYIAAEHLPARTPDGETVTVHACVSDKTDLATALDQGADGIVVNLAGWESGSSEDLAAIMRTAAGKPIAFEVEGKAEEILRAAMYFASPHQVTLLFPAATFDAAVERTNSVLELIIAEALFEDLSPPRVGFGIAVHETELTQSRPSREPTSYLIDVRKSAAMSLEQDELTGRVTEWTTGCSADQVVILLGRQVEFVTKLVKAGVRAFAVDADIVSVVKTAIREMASE
ncbi:MAG: hypothetical protein N3B12_07725 [Armatimonadetes bacterium]|nr:hypothetical protein [Armatimonadota bacterium]